jgi:hypothetical protein
MAVLRRASMSAWNLPGGASPTRWESGAARRIAGYEEGEEDGGGVLEERLQ